MPNPNMPADTLLIARAKGTREPSVLSLYACPDTHEIVACNRMPRPFSPFGAHTMARVNPNSMTVTSAEIRNETIRLGTCPTCASKHYTLPVTVRAAALNPKFTDFHCITCGEVVPVRADLANLYGEDGTKISPSGDIIMDNALSAPDTNADDASHFAGAPVEVGHDTDSTQSPNLNALSSEDEEGDGEDSDGEENEDSDGGDASGEGQGEEGEEGTGEGDGEGDEPEAEGEDEENSEGDGEGEESKGEEGSDGDEGDNEDGEVAAATRSLVANSRRRQQVRRQPTQADISEDSDGDQQDETDDEVTSAAKTIKTLVVTAFDAIQPETLTKFGVLSLDAETAAVFATDDGYLPLLLLEAKNATPDNKKLFTDPDKLTKAFEAVAGSDNFVLSADSLKPFGAKAFSFDVTCDALIQSRIDTGITAATAALQQERDALGKSMRQCLSIAGMEILKNLSGATPNPVRAALVDEMGRVGVREAGRMVDFAFAKHGEPLLKAVIAKAMELLTKPLEVRNEIARYVSEATVQPVVIASETNDVAKSLAEGSLSVSASTAEGDLSAVDNEAKQGSNPVLTALVRSSMAARRSRF